ncbi:arginine N-succinyltransferase [Sandaracinobacteroides saxicola]|uniref:Arginine N-succinyltransferase n=2 Tax=Sandaracinobacteroides saxicola TaxID=2759707 RepID=A0A7G5IMB4_9SPHN|nr:arginine N-succinyltransferase [Sandaracinobacteroides saxicola]
MDIGELHDWHIRTACASDVDALYALAQLTGGGFTNLPPDRDELALRINWSLESLAAALDGPQNELYMLVLAHRRTQEIAGTACLFSRVGVEWPFYSYKLTTLSKQSKELGRTLSTQVLHLVNDYDGASEVGGLFLHPARRTGGLGRLLARSRYLFVARHRARFGDRMIAELRGVIDETGNSPFWDGLAGRFFGMDFREADKFNSLHGNQFIADLMPKHAVYAALLPESARAVIGQCHPAGRAALAMLAKEGFVHNGYIDIFDGGPTVECATDRITSVATARRATARAGSAAGEARLVAAGEAERFTARVTLGIADGDTLRVPASADLDGQDVSHVIF